MLIDFVKLVCYFQPSIKTLLGSKRQALKLFFVIVVFVTESVVGTHELPVKCVEYCPEVNVIVTGSWDQTVKLWDPRTPCNAGSFSQPDKVHIYSVTSL